MTMAVATKGDDFGLPEGFAYGPAMAALSNDRQRAFVMHFVLLGNGTEAARRQRVPVRRSATACGAGSRLEVEY